MKMKEVTIDGVVYVEKNSTTHISNDGLKMTIIRTYSAGVFMGYLAREESTLAGMEVTLLNARRLWSWSGAASLSQLAMEGTKAPEECKFPCEVNSIDLVAIEKIPMTKVAVKSLNSVPIWKM
jgi:hypothetical protein